MRRWNKFSTTTKFLRPIKNWALSTNYLATLKIQKQVNFHSFWAIDLLSRGQWNTGGQLLKGGRCTNSRPFRWGWPFMAATIHSNNCKRYWWITKTCFKTYFKCASKIYKWKSVYFCTFPPSLLDSRLMMAFIPENQVQSLVPIHVYNIILQKWANSQVIKIQSYSFLCRRL